jgi:two-component system, sensor histidine kinase and response regulator
MLLNWGMEPTLVESGPGALAAMETARLSGKPFGLAIIDYLMPVMDGFALAELVKKNPELSSMTIIMLTSAGQRGDSVRCTDVGIAAYLRKPVKQSDLFDSIAYTLTPAANDENQPSLITRHSLRVSKRGLSLLLVEDNPVNRKLAVKMLEKMGHRVSTAGNGRQALEILDRESFDAVFMDVQMPEMDGYEATATIRSKERATGEHVPIIAMTAHAMKGDRERCLEVGMDGYVAKPINSAELFDTLETLMERKGGPKRLDDRVDLGAVEQATARSLIN